MSSQKYLNINYPFRNSPKGFYVDLTETDGDAVKADLMHLLLTNKGERYYLPDFGTNLLRFIFEPNDAITISSIREDISTTVRKYIPNLQIDEVNVTPNEDDRFQVQVRVDYTITEDVFSSSDFVIINL